MADTNFNLDEGVQGAFLGGTPVNLAYLSGSFKPLSTQTVAFLGDTAVYGARTVKIPTNDLRMYVNANINASYPGSGSTWFDIKSTLDPTLTTDRDLTLDASPTFVTGTPNYFDFTDGTDAAQYKPGGTRDSLTSQGDDYTVVMFFTYHDSSGNYRTLFRDVNGSTLTDFFIVDTGTNDLGVYSDTNGGFRQLGTIEVNTDIPNYTTQFNMQTYVNNKSETTKALFYLNDDASALGTSIYPLQFDGPASFGNQDTGGQPGANIAAILVYDRVLSARERQDIYAILSAEMGL